MVFASETLLPLGAPALLVPCAVLKPFTDFCSVLLVLCLYDDVVQILQDAVTPVVSGQPSHPDILGRYHLADHFLKYLLDVQVLGPLAHPRTLHHHGLLATLAIGAHEIHSFGYGLSRVYIAEGEVLAPSVRMLQHHHHPGHVLAQVVAVVAVPDDAVHAILQDAVGLDSSPRANLLKAAVGLIADFGADDLVPLPSPESLVLPLRLV